MHFIILLISLVSVLSLLERNDHKVSGDIRDEMTMQMMCLKVEMLGVKWLFQHLTETQIISLISFCYFCNEIFFVSFVLDLIETELMF